MIENIFYNILSFFFRKKNRYIIYHSFPDVSDNSFAFFIYIINNYPVYKNIWIIDDFDRKNQYIKKISNYTSSKNYSIIKKKSFLGIYFYLKSKYLIHTHGLYNEFNLDKSKVNINLWHGMPLKNVGYLDNNKRIPKSNYIISTAKIYQKVLSNAFAIDLKNVKVTGLPRNDFFVEKKYNLAETLGFSTNEFQNIILWMPTYRKSIIGDIRIDGENTRHTDILNDNCLEDLNNFLIKINSLCCVKIHPMDYMSVKDFKKKSNIVFIDNDFFLFKGIEMYSILNSTDLLLTDISSVYIDYLLLNKPIGFVFSDYNEYLNSRGFIFENQKDLMPGEFITNKKDLISFLEDVFVKNKDNFKQKRNEINDFFNEEKKDFSEKIFSCLMKKK